MSELSILTTLNLPGLLGCAVDSLRQLNTALLLAKDQCPVIFLEDSVNDTFLNDLSAHHLPTVENLLKNYLSYLKSSSSDDTQIEFVRQMLIRNVIPHFEKIHKNFSHSSQIDVIEVQFADLYISNLKDQMGYL